LTARTPFSRSRAATAPTPSRPSPPSSRSFASTSAYANLGSIPTATAEKIKQGTFVCFLRLSRALEGVVEEDSKGRLVALSSGSGAISLTEQDPQASIAFFALDPGVWQFSFDIWSKHHSAAFPDQNS
jgi:hypothetical protein